MREGCTYTYMKVYGLPDAQVLEIPRRGHGSDLAGLTGPVVHIINQRLVAARECRSEKVARVQVVWESVSIVDGASEPSRTILGSAAPPRVRCACSGSHDLTDCSPAIPATSSIYDE